MKGFFTLQARPIFLAAGFIVALGAVGWNVYQYDQLSNQYAAEIAHNENLSYQSAELSDKLSAANATNDDLKTLLGARIQETEAMGAQVATLTSAVGTLDRLSKTDKELLEKYSSVYFLNENYTPQNLVQIDPSYLNRPTKPEQVINGIYGHLASLLSDASSSGVALQVLSAYRSFGTQAALKDGYKMTYGAGTANSFSADQGYSEHQLGTTIDFTTPKLGAALSGFDKTASYTWLQNNAYKYGFNMSYPKGNAHFIFEPWHWRYVGVELAKKLHDENKSLYDMDQRDIDQYLIKFFD